MCVIRRTERDIDLLSLRINKMSSLKVSLFFSRIPRTSYSTLEVKKNKTVSMSLNDLWACAV